MKANITIHDEVNVNISGLETRDIEALYEKFGVFAKGYRHQVRYKLGRWDGKIRHFHKTGKTFVKLLPEIVQYLQNREYDFDINDHRVKKDLSVPLIDKNYLIDRGYDIELGEHQVRGINALTSNSGEIFEGGTGAGKTIMTAILAQLYEDAHKFKCIVIVPTSDLIRQTHLEMMDYGVDVGMYGDQVKDFDHHHLVSTWQSLQHNPGLIGQYQVVIVDECHGVTGETLRTILNDHGAKCLIRMGLTGTLPEEPIDEMAVRITLGNVVEKVEASELIACGWLAELKLYMYELNEDMREEFAQFCVDHPDKAADVTYKQYKLLHAFPDYTAEKKYIQKSEKRLDFLAKIISVSKKNTMVLVPNVEFGRKIAKKIPNAMFFYGKDSKKIRQEIYKSFDSNDDIIAITTYSLASTGLNIKRIFNLYLIDSGKSYVKVIQSIGRGLRKAHDKTKVMVYDIFSDLKFSKRHAGARKKHYAKKTYKYKYQKVDYTQLL